MTFREKFTVFRHEKTRDASLEKDEWPLGDPKSRNSKEDLGDSGFSVGRMSTNA
jgi:hypothetical protein